MPPTPPRPQDPKTQIPKTPRPHLEAILGPPWGLHGALLGPSWGPLWAILGPLAASWALLVSSCSILGPSRGHLGASWGHLGANLGPTWAQLGPNLGPTWALLGPTWALLGPTWALLAPWLASWGNRGATLEQHRKAKQNQQKNHGKSRFLSVCNRLVCLCGKVLETLLGYLRGVLGMLEGCVGDLGFRAGVLNPCRARSGESTCAMGAPRPRAGEFLGGGVGGRRGGVLPSSPDPSPRYSFPARGCRITPHTPAQGSADLFRSSSYSNSYPIRSVFWLV